MSYFLDIHGSNLLTAFGAEVSFRLPREASPLFAQFFTRLGDIAAHLGIDSYGVSMTTLEEVFLRIGLESKYLFCCFFCGCGCCVVGCGVVCIVCWSLTAYRVERDSEEEGDDNKPSDKDLSTLMADKNLVGEALNNTSNGHSFKQQLRALLVKRRQAYPF